MKKVMILSATYWQIPLMKSLKEKGCYVIAVSPVKDSPAFSYADEIHYIDILDKKKCLALAQELQVDAVMSEQCDIANPTIAFISEQMNLRSMGMKCARLFTDKYAMREYCKQNGFYYPEYKKCYSVEEAIQFFEQIKCKMIMKPLDSNSSRGVVTIEQRNEIEKFFNSSIAYSKIEKAVICERYIEGTEFTVDGIKTEEKHVSLAISEKRHFAHNQNIACTLFFSYDNENYDYNELREINDRLIEKSDLPFGLTHAEYKYENGKWYLIEIGCRGGGNLISSDIVPAVSGVNTYDYLIDWVLKGNGKLDLKVDDIYRKKCAVLQFFDSNGQEGIVEKWEGEEFLKENKDVLVYQLNCKTGDEVLLAADDSKRIGYYIAQGASKKELLDLMEEIEREVRVVIKKKSNDFINLIHEPEIQGNVLEELRDNEYPVVVWGCGSLAYSVRKILEKNKIHIECYWVDGINENNEYDGIEIKSMSQIMNDYPKINVVFGHSKYELKATIIKKYPIINKCYCLVNVCYGQWEPILYSFVVLHQDEYKKTYEELSDELSKMAMVAYLNCRLNEDIDYVLSCLIEKADYFENSIFRLSDNEVYVDIGAYTGDSIEKFLEASQGNYKKIIAFEPEKNSLNLLYKYVRENELENIDIHEVGTWNKSTKLTFKEDEESTCIAQKNDNGIVLDVVKVDEIITEEISIVKINFLNGVKETLEGMESLIKKNHPKLVITVGFDEWGLIDIPQTIKKIDASYTIYLRYAAAMPARLILYAV